MGVAKVIAFTCTALTVVLMIAATSTSDWMITSGWREGLFSQCTGSRGMTPVPFSESRDYEFLPGCYKGRGIGYLLGVTALVIIGLIADFLATVFLGIDVFKNTKKYKKLSVIGLSTAGVALLLAVIIYGVYFSEDLHDEPSLDGRIWDAYAFNDWDNDGIPDGEDPDDDNAFNDWDNDGIPDDEDPDDDNDSIPDDLDLDDDNDGILDIEDSDHEDFLGDPDDKDLDNDGIPDDEDLDDDGDGSPDDEDPDDNNGILDIEDSDDDNWQDDDMDVEEQEGPRRVFSYGYGFGATCFSIVLIFVSVGLIIIDRESKQVDDHDNQIEQGLEEQGGNA